MMQNNCLRPFCVILLAMAFSWSLMAQDKQFTLDDLIPGGKTHYRFMPRTLKQLQWCGDTYLYAKGDTLMQCTLPRLQETVALTRSSLNEALKSVGLPEAGSLPAFSTPYKDRTLLSFKLKGHLLHYDWTTRQVVADYPLPAKGENYDFCPENRCFAFTEGNNLCLLTAEGAVTRISSEGEGIVVGQAVHQREFGITKGTFWSPSGTALAFYRMDESMVTTYPLVNIDARCAELVPHKYPMAGMASHHVTVGIFYPATGKTVWLKTGLPKEKYLTNISWSPDGQSLYIAELNRSQDDMRLVRYNARSGEREAELFAETDAHYVEPQHPLLFLPGNPEQFIWQSRRDGFNHLYLYDIHGKMLRQLTAGPWEVLDVLGFNAKENRLYYSSTQPAALDAIDYGDALYVSTWALNLKNNKSYEVTGSSNQRQGVHSSRLSFSGKYLLDTYSDPVTPRRISLVETKKGETIRTLLTAKDPYAGYAMPEIETGKLTAADDSTLLNYRLVKPLHLDENRKYPAIVYVYGGPHAQLVSGGWKNGVGGWDLYMAQQGYVVFTLDSRGSANRGKAFEQVIHRNLGVHEMADQLKGVDYLKSLPFVDAERIGVHGWSYGGFMTTNLICSYPDVFKVGVAGGPVIDWSKYEIMYGERYMDRPQENPEGYKNADLKLKAKNLKGRLLLIHGDIDPVVVWQHSLGFLKACVDANTYPDYMVYPRHPHNVIGKDRPHLYRTITRYFEEHL